MLHSVRITNFAIIDELTLEFAGGLNVLTGETGAGKSIIMQALGLLCGTRGAADLIRTGAAEAAIEAVFELSEGERRAAVAMGLADTDEISIRRSISRTGKGRVHLDGSPATVAVLGQLGMQLLHIYGQHEHALLLHPDTHLDLLDDFGRLQPLRERVGTAFQQAAERHQHWLELRRSGQAARERAELLGFQIAELEAAAFETGEETRLAQEREVLRHAEQLARACHDGEAALYSDDGAVSSLLRRVYQQLRDLERVDPQLGDIAALIDSARTHVDEAAGQLRRYADRVHADPERLAEIDERLALMRRLARKYGCSGDELAAQLATQRADLDQLERAGTDVEGAHRARTEAADHAWKEAKLLSAARRRAARELEERIRAELPRLGLAGAQFVVPFEDNDGARDWAAEDPFVRDRNRLTDRGYDRVEFQLSANPGEQVRPLARVASGGELSRIMLALKVLTAGAGEAGTLIFDEVDAGIGGTVAEAVGRRLKLLAQGRQILCITHLPQIAVHADHHFSVEKRLTKGRTVTSAKPLSETERIVELSRMLGGAVVSREAERYARRLMAEAQK
ncbi:MAG TPA: DNA repair protein RecN [Candidatus Binatia bacterium]|nr:DNA repair protein RecN [Candidatus Binatia bacterium]